MQWDSLESYFLSNFDLDDDPNENNPNEKHIREKRMVKAFKLTGSKLYVMFIQSVIPIFGSLNSFLKTEELLTQILYQATLSLYRSLLSRLILSEVISESDDVLSIDLEDPNVLNDFNSIFIEAMTKQYARDSGIIVTYEYKKFLQEVRAFFIKYEKYLKTSMPVLKNDIIKSLTFLCLSERHET